MLAWLAGREREQWWSIWYLVPLRFAVGKGVFLLPENSRRVAKKAWNFTAGKSGLCRR